MRGGRKMIVAHIELGGQLEVVNLEEVATRSEAIELIWTTYGIMTPIFELFEEEDLVDGEIDS
jgi:hypothetical protein